MKNTSSNLAFPHPQPRQESHPMKNTSSNLAFMQAAWRLITRPISDGPGTINVPTLRDAFESLSPADQLDANPYAAICGESPEFTRGVYAVSTTLMRILENPEMVSFGAKILEELSILTLTTLITTNIHPDTGRPINS